MMVNISLFGDWYRTTEKSSLSVHFFKSILLHITCSLHMQCVGKLHPDVISWQVSQLIEHLREEKVEATLFQRDSRENQSAHPREFLNKELKERPVASCWRLIYQVVFIYIYIYTHIHTHYTTIYTRICNYIWSNIIYICYHYIWCLSSRN